MQALCSFVTCCLLLVAASGLTKPISAFGDFLIAPEAANISSNRLSVAIIGFENKTGDATNHHWGVMLYSFLFERFGEIKQ
jgi:hypothetical protein